MMCIITSFKTHFKRVGTYDLGLTQSETKFCVSPMIPCLFIVILSEAKDLIPLTVNQTETASRDPSLCSGWQKKLYMALKEVNPKTHHPEWSVNLLLFLNCNHKINTRFLYSSSFIFRAYKISVQYSLCIHNIYWNYSN